MKKKLLSTILIGILSLVAVQAQIINGYRQTSSKTVDADGNVVETTETYYDEKGNEAYTITSLASISIPGLPSATAPTKSKSVMLYDENNHNVKVENYEMMDGDWAMLGYTNQSEFDSKNRPHRMEGWELNEETGEFEKTSLVVVERYTDDFCILESVQYVWVKENNDWQKMQESNGIVNDHGCRESVTATSSMSIEGVTFDVSVKTSYTYYYEPVTCYKSIKIETIMNGVVDKNNSNLTEFEYEFNDAGLPIVQKYIVNGVNTKTTYYTYEEIPATGIAQVKKSAKAGVYSVNGIYKGEKLSEMPKGMYIVRDSKGIRKVLK